MSCPGKLEAKQRLEFWSVHGKSRVTYWVCLLRVVGDPWLLPNPSQTQVFLLSTISYGSCSWSLGWAIAPGRPEQDPKTGSGSVSINERWDSGSSSTSLASKPSPQILPPMAGSTLHRGPYPKKDGLSYVYCPSASILPRRSPSALKETKPYLNYVFMHTRLYWTKQQFQTTAISNQLPSIPMTPF